MNHIAGFFLILITPLLLILYTIAVVINMILDPESTILEDYDTEYL